MIHSRNAFGRREKFTALGLPAFAIQTGGLFTVPPGQVHSKEKRVCVSGVIEADKDAPRIIVRRADQLVEKTLIEQPRRPERPINRMLTCLNHSMTRLTA